MRAKPEVPTKTLSMSPSIRELTPRDNRRCCILIANKDINNRLGPACWAKLQEPGQLVAEHLVFNGTSHRYRPFCAIAIGEHLSTHWTCPTKYDEHIHGDCPLHCFLPSREQTPNSALPRQSIFERPPDYLMRITPGCMLIRLTPGFLSMSSEVTITIRSL